MMNGGHWDLQRSLTSGAVIGTGIGVEGGYTGVCDVFQKWCLEVASDVGGNGTAVLVITMGHGEGRKQAGLVDGVRIGACERFYLT